MRKTARPVVWEAGRAQSRPVDLIKKVNALRFRFVAAGIPDS